MIYKNCLRILDKNMHHIHFNNSETIKIVIYKRQHYQLRHFPI